MAASALISLGRLLEPFQPIQAFSLGPEGAAPLGQPPSILFGPVLEIAGEAEMFCGVESPERVEQHLAGKEDEVRPIFLQNLLGELRLRNTISDVSIFFILRSPYETCR